MSRLRTVITATLLLVALTGCAQNEYPIFDRTAETNDALPPELPDYASENLDAQTARLAGELDGT